MESEREKKHREERKLSTRHLIYKTAKYKKENFSNETDQTKSVRKEANDESMLIEANKFVTTESKQIWNKYNKYVIAVTIYFRLICKGHCAKKHFVCKSEAQIPNTHTHIYQQTDTSSNQKKKQGTNSQRLSMCYT